MLIIRKNQLNNLVVTVSMNKTLPSPYYLFSFQHIASKERVIFLPEPVVSNTRYDKFRFNEASVTDLTITPPSVNFNYLGQYYYSIYEQISSGNTNPSLAYNKLESGRAVVIIDNSHPDECFFEPYISNNEDFANLIYVSDDEEVCIPIPTPTPTSTSGVTPTPTPTLTPTPSCNVTTQYLNVELSESTKFKLSLWNDSGYTSPTNALCDYIISGTAYGSLGTVYSGVESITTGQHQYQFNLSPVLLPGEIVESFVVLSYTTQGCVCPVNLILPPEPCFDVGIGFVNTVETCEIQSDGKILVGGLYFSSYDGISANRLIRLNTDGTKDTSFDIGTGFGGIGLLDIKIQSDGKIIAGGPFTLFTGETNNRLIRLNTDGTKDTSFNIGSGFNDIVQKVVIQSDGKILVGGEFTSFDGNSQNRLIRLNSDGTKDTSFDIGSGFTGSTGQVLALALQSDGKILVGGAFTSFNGTSYGKIIRLNSDGSLDTSFNNIQSLFGGSLNPFIQAIDVQSDGKILVGGEFFTFNGNSQFNIIRLNSDGTKDTSFVVNNGFNNDVYVIKIQPDGKILVGGQFDNYNLISSPRIARLNPDGSLDTSFDVGLGTTNVISDLSLLNNGNIFLPGPLTYNGIFAGRLAKLSSTGELLNCP